LKYLLAKLISIGYLLGFIDLSSHG
jgi:hypothetical protein